MNEDIIEVLKSNYLPYAVEVIQDRALPSIDGLKISMRRLLWKMYSLGLLNPKADTIKSANMCGRVLELHPHGDGAVYDTMVRLAQTGAMLYPFIFTKGNFGEYLSTEMPPAASRYTEVKLNPICEEFFKGIKSSIDFIPSYDGKTVEPDVLSTTFPNILCNPTIGIAVGVSSKICSFNLEEVCNATIAYLKDNNVNFLDYITAPDFPTGGEYLWDAEELKNIINTGKGSLKIRAKYRYNEKENSIEIYELPYTTKIEKVVDKIIQLVKERKIDIKDIKDETDYNGMQITIYLKKGTNVKNLMAYLYKNTTLEDTFACNFKVLIDNQPLSLNFREIIDEWVKYRKICLTRMFSKMEQDIKKDIHIIYGLQKIKDSIRDIVLFNVSHTKNETINMLKNNYGLDDIQSNFVVSLKLSSLNTDTITKIIQDLISKQEQLEDITHKLNNLEEVIIEQLQEVIEKYKQPRRTEVLKDYVEVEEIVEQQQDNRNVVIFFTKQGYLKKIPAISLRGGGEQLLKDGDEIISTIECKDSDNILLFSNIGNIYNQPVKDIEDCKPSSIGVFTNSDTECIVNVVLNDNKGDVLLVYKDGYIGRVSIDSYNTNYRKIIGNTDKKLKAVFKIHEECDILMISTQQKAVLFGSNEINAVKSKKTKGVRCIKGNVSEVHLLSDTQPALEQYRCSRDRVGIHFSRKGVIL